MTQFLKVAVETVFPLPELPEWSAIALWWLGAAMIVFFLLWLVATAVTHLHRRAYNLTKAETDSQRKAAQPGFLKVDHEARSEAIKRGDEYVRPADREEPGVESAPAERRLSFWQRWGFLARAGALVVALAHIVVAALSLPAMARRVTEGMQRIQEASTGGSLEEMLKRYWIGFALAAIVIGAQVGRFAWSLRKK